MNPWDRTPEESTPAWQAFAAYRDAGLERSLVTVARALGKSETLMSRWSVRHRWVERAAAWDARRDQVQQDAELSAIEDATKRHLGVAKALISKALEGLQSLPATALEPAEIRQWLATGARIENAALGRDKKQPADKSEQGAADIDAVDAIPEDELLEVLRDVMSAKA